MKLVKMAFLVVLLIGAGMITACHGSGLFDQLPEYNNTTGDGSNSDGNTA